MNSRIDPVEAVRRAGGTVTRAALLQVVTRRCLEHAVASGTLVTTRRRWICLPDAGDARVVALHHDGVLGGLSAAQHWNWKVKFPPAQPIVIVPRNRGRGSSGVHLVRRDLSVDDLDGPALSRHATVLDCARSLPFDEALTVADSALRRPDVNVARLLQAARQLPRGRDRVERVLLHASGRSANPFESVARAIALDVPGLNVEPQGWVVANDHADLVDHHLGLAIECDSWSWHASNEALWRKDVRRYNRMTLAGWVVIRLLWEDVMHRPDVVRAQLAEAVEAARRTPRDTFPGRS